MLEKGRKTKPNIMLRHFLVPVFVSSFSSWSLHASATLSLFSCNYNRKYSLKKGYSMNVSSLKQ